MPVKKTKRRVGRKPAVKRAAKRGAKKAVRGRRRVSKVAKTTRKSTAKPKKRGRKPGRKAAKKVVKKKATKKRGKRGRKKASGKKAAAKAEVARGGLKRSSRRNKTSSAGSKKKLTNFLTSSGVKFTVVKHSPAVTAQQVAESAHVPGKELAKTVIVKIDGRLAMVIEPAYLKVNLETLRRQIGAEQVELATENEFKAHFPSCEVGAMPPFGNLYGMEVYVSQHLSHENQIAFNAGTHAELMKISYDDFFNMVKPKIIYD